MIPKCADINGAFTPDFTKCPSLQPILADEQSLLTRLLRLQSELLDIINTSRPLHTPTAVQGLPSCFDLHNDAGAHIHVTPFTDNERLEWLTSEWAAFSFNNPSSSLADSNGTPAAPPLQLTTTNLCWCNATTDVPHLIIEATTLPGTTSILLYLALIPRKDAVLDPSYLDTYYSSTAVGKSVHGSSLLRSWAELCNACETHGNGWKPHRSKFPAVNYLGCGLSCGYVVPENDIEFAASIAREAVQLWLAFLDSYSGSPTASQEEQESLNKRDISVRRFGVWGDPYFKMLGGLIGQEVLQQLGDTLTKG